MERDLFNKKYMYEKDLKKRATCRGKDPSDDECGHQKRPTYIKIDQHTRKESYMQGKRPVKKTNSRKTNPKWKPMQDKNSPNENNIDTKDPGDDGCGRQKRPTYVETNLHTWKETCSKKNIPQMTTTRYQRPRWWRMWPSKETYIHENRPTNTKRDLFKTCIYENIPQMKTTRYQKPWWWRYWLWSGYN